MPVAASTIEGFTEQLTRRGVVHSVATYAEAIINGHPG